MPNKKITQLTELTSAAEDDVFVVVDISDTTQDVTGTTKKIKSSNVGGGTGSTGSTTLHAYDVNADFNAPGGVFSAGMLNPARDDKLQLLRDGGQFIDNYGDQANIASLVDMIVDGAAKLKKAIDPGTGADGDVTISANKNLNTDTIAAGRTEPDGAAFNATQLTSNAATLDSTPNSGTFAVGDEVMLISLQGYGSQTGNVGNYEFLTIAEISGNVLTFSTAIEKNYGDDTSQLNLGTGSNKHKVMVMRVPNYQNVTIDSGVTLTCNGWNGAKFGVLAFRASGTLTVNGTISANTKGYARSMTGGNSRNPGKFQGHSKKPGANGSTGSIGANHAGGGAYNPLAVNEVHAGGGGHFNTGGSGNSNAPGGEIIGDADLTQIFFGGTGGAAISESGQTITTTSGGIIMVGSENCVINSTALFTANGSSSSGGGGDGSGGGSAGGSILIHAVSAQIFNTSITVNGGSGQNSFNGTGGSGSVGRVKFVYQTLSDGTLYSGSHINNVQVNGQFVSSGNFESTDVVNGKTVTGFSTFVTNLSSKPPNTTATVQFSQDAVTWYDSAGVSGQADTIAVGANQSIDISGLGWTAGPFYYRIDYTGDGSGTPVLEDVKLDYTPISYTSGEQTWASAPIGDGTSDLKPTDFLADWVVDSDNSIPKFQVQGSNTGGFTGEETIFPAGVGTFFQSGGIYSIDDNVKLSLLSYITGTMKYWRIKAFMDAGATVTDAPTVEKMELTVNDVANASGIARAWGEFDGTPSSPAFTSQLGFSAIEKLGTGIYKLTLAQALNEAKAAVLFGQRAALGNFGTAHLGQGDREISLLLHMDGSDGSTSFPDSSLYNHTVTANGNAQIDTAQSKFGGAAGLFDGTGDYLSVPDNSLWQLGTDDFTIRFWVRLASVGSIAGLVGSVDGNPTVTGWIVQKNGSDQISFFTNNGSVNIVGSTSLLVDTWYHVEITRSGSDFRVFLDGVEDGSGTSSVNIVKSTSGLHIAHWNDFSNDLNGWIDDLEIIKGSALHTTNFTPPASAHADPDGPINLDSIYVETTDMSGNLTDLPYVSVAVFEE